MIRADSRLKRQKMRTSKKGTYLAVMAVIAVLFVVYLYIAPSFVNGGEPIPLFAYGIMVIAFVVIAAGLSIWRARVKKLNPLDRQEGIVSGQDDHHRR